MFSVHNVLGVYLTIISIGITVGLTVYVYRMGVKQNDFLSANVKVLNVKMNLKKETERSEEAIRSFTNKIETEKDIIKILLDRIDDDMVKKKIELIIGEIALELLKRQNRDIVGLFSNRQTIDE